MKLIWLIAIGIFLAPAVLYPELLVIKKENGHFAPLTEADLPDSQKIMDIILKYEWPMCIASDLTPEEQNALLTPDKPFAEERFIQQKIQESVGKQYEVVFVPTAIYELFCLLQRAKMQTNQETTANPFKTATQDILIAKEALNLLSILNSDASPTSIRREIFDAYMKVNAIFFDGTDNATFFINALLGKFLFDTYPELAENTTTPELTDTIQSKSNELSTQLRTSLITIARRQPRNKIPWYIAELTHESQRNIINKVIQLEYEAGQANKGLLLRGTSFEALQVGFGKEPKESLLAGSTVLKDYGLKKAYLEKAYKEKTLQPYSISFGNSLFAGAVNDQSACAYNYLAENKNAIGYALSIDKKAYVEHQNNNLFFIAPTATITALFLSGEYFHSRTKVALPSKKSGPLWIKGLMGSNLPKDSTGVLLITRDPLRQAELFSKFLAENGHVIQTGNTDDLTDEEKNFAEHVKQSQHEAAQFYKATRTMKSAIDRAVEKFRQKKDEGRQKQEQEYEQNSQERLRESHE